MERRARFPHLPGLLFLAALCPFAAPAPAAASNIVYLCGQDLCSATGSGKAVKRLTRDGRTRLYSRPSISRSGRRLAFRTGVRGRVFTATLRRRRGRIVGLGRRRRIQPFRDAARHATQFDVALSPDGRRVAWVELRINALFRTIDYRRYSARFDGSDARQVAASGGRPFVGWYGSARILREGLTPAIDDRQTGESVDQGICVPSALSAANGTCRSAGALQVAFDPRGRHLRNPSHSPDGRLLVATAYASGDQVDNSVERPGAIALFDARTAAPLRDLTSGPNDLRATFAPNGRAVAFERRNAIWSVAVRAGNAKRLVRRGRHPAWSR